MLALPVAALSACKVVDPFQPTLTVTLTVVEQGWTGWSTEQPEPETSIEEVTEGSEFTRTAMGQDIAFTVLSVTARKLRLRTSTALSEREEGGGIDLRTDQDTFTVRAGGSLSITTPTMDAGTTFTLRYAE